MTRGLRPVHWSPATRTALAEAELEYQDAHVSVAAYVAFPLLPAGDGAGGSAARPPRLAALLDGGAGAVAAPVWTTTPWTLPGNEAVARTPSSSTRSAPSATRREATWRRGPPR